MMKNRAVYNYALALLGETTESSGNHDYLTRSPILLMGIYAQYSVISELLKPGSGDLPAEPVSLDADFTLDERLFVTAGFALASRLVCDESAEFSELLDESAKLTADKLFASVESTREVY